MPYFDDKEDENNQNQQNPQNENSVQISSSAPTADSSGSLGGAHSASSSSQSNNNFTSQQPLNTGSGYHDLSAYLQNNNQTGNQVNEKIQNQFSQAQQGITDSANQFSNQVKQSNQTPSSDQIQNAVSNAKNASSADQAQYQGWENQKYQGPTSYVNSGQYQQAQNGINQAQQTANLANTGAGRFTLLQSYFGNSGTPYTTGETNLDNQLLGQSSSFNPAQYQAQASQLSQKANQTEQDLQNQIGLAAGNVEKSAQNARNAVGIDASGNPVNTGAFGVLANDLQSETNQANQENLNAYNQLLSDLQNGSLNEGEFQATGIQPGSSLYGVNPLNYVTQGKPLTQNQVISPSEIAQAQALANLSGTSNPYPNTPLTSTPAFSFNKDSFQNDVSKAKTNAAKDWSQISNQIEQDYSGNPNYLQSIGVDPNNPASLQAFLKNSQMQGGMDPNRVQNDLNLIQTYLDQYNPNQQIGRNGGRPVRR